MIWLETRNSVNAALTLKILLLMVAIFVALWSAIIGHAQEEQTSTIAYGETKPAGEDYGRHRFWFDAHQGDELYAEIFYNDATIPAELSLLDERGNLITDSWTTLIGGGINVPGGVSELRYCCIANDGRYQLLVGYGFGNDLKLERVMGNVRTARSCGLPSHLEGGARAQNISDAEVVLRAVPSAIGERIDVLAPGQIVRVLQGPFTSYNLHWWQVATARAIGFVAERHVCEYIMAPFTFASATSGAIKRGGGRLRYGDVGVGQLDDRNFFDDYVFGARAGDRVTIAMHGTTPGFDTALRLYNSAARELAFADTGDVSADALISRFRIPADGEYVIHALRPDADESGEYELRLSSSTPLAAEGATGVITLDVACGLADAIVAANEDRAAGGCPAGNGADTIVLSGDIILDEELPPIESEITLAGGGHSISGDDRLRIFYVGKSGDFAVKQATLTSGSVTPSNVATFACNERGIPNRFKTGGAICNRGRLKIIDSVFSKNGAYVTGAIDNLGELAITNSQFIGNNSYIGAGAVSNYSSLTVTNSIFSENSSNFAGGAISNHGELQVTESEFNENFSNYLGGGAIYSSGRLAVTDSRFSGNFTHGEAGAILADLNQQTDFAQVDGSTFINNRPEDCSGVECVNSAGGGRRGAQATDASGAIRVGGTCSLADAIIALNERRSVGRCPASGAGATFQLAGNITLDAPLPEITADVVIDGGGYTLSGGRRTPLIRVNGAHVVIDNLTLADGLGSWNAGAILAHNRAELTITNAVFSNNSAKAAGGALLVQDSKVAISDSRFVSNSADTGGAIHVRGLGTLTIDNAMFDSNVTNSHGSAVNIENQSARLSNVRLRNNRGGQAVVHVLPGAGSVEINCLLELSGNAPNLIDPAVSVSEQDCTGSTVSVSQPAATRAGASDSCALTPRLQTGMNAQNIDGADTRMRSRPGLGQARVGAIAPGEVVRVLDGPEFADGYHWWRVRKNDNSTGWTAEGGNCEYWLAPTDGRASVASVASSGGATRQGGGHLGYGDSGAGYLDNNRFLRRLQI